MFGPRRPFLFEGLYGAWRRRSVGRICLARHALWVCLLLKRLCAQAGDVDVGIVAAGDIELVLDSAQQVKVAPCRLGGLQDLAVLRRGGIDRGGAKRADAQRSDALVRKLRVDGVDGLLRSRGRDLLALQDGAVCIARGTDHLGAAGPERSDKLLLCHSGPLSGTSCSFSKV